MLVNSELSRCRWSIGMTCAVALVRSESFSVEQLCHRLLGRPASESGKLRHGDGDHGRSERRPLYQEVDAAGSPKARYPVAAMATLLDDLDAFYLEHRRCGALDTGIEGGPAWMTCE